ncbi:MAG: hypothetical protein ACQEQU_03935 [Spirochaetota bacterium]
MSIPLNLLVDKDYNTYEVTCVAIKNAARLTKNGDEEIEAYGDKVVSIAIAQVLEDRIRYERREEE